MKCAAIEYRCAPEHALELVLCREGPRDYPWHFHARQWTFGLVRRGFVVIAGAGGEFRLAAGRTFAVAPLAPHRLRIEDGGSLAVLCSPSGEAAAAGTARLETGIGDAGGDAAAWLRAPGDNVDVLLRPRALEEASPVGAARALLAARPGDHVPLETLARLAGYSPWHFLRSFRKETGFTPHAFQLLCRLSLARRLLRTGTAAEAAASAGFADQSHLHKVFKRHHGLTPRQFAEASLTL